MRKSEFSSNGPGMMSFLVRFSYSQRHVSIKLCWELCRGISEWCSQACGQTGLGMGLLVPLVIYCWWTLYAQSIFRNLRGKHKFKAIHILKIYLFEIFYLFLLKYKHANLSAMICKCFVLVLDDNEIISLWPAKMPII